MGTPLKGRAEEHAQKLARMASGSGLFKTVDRKAIEKEWQRIIEEENLAYWEQLAIKRRVYELRKEHEAENPPRRSTMKRRRKCKKRGVCRRIKYRRKFYTRARLIKMIGKRKVKALLKRRGR